MGARKFLSDTDNNPENLGENDNNLHLIVPDLAILADYGDADEIFEEIFKDDEQKTKIDVMEQMENYGVYEETDENGDSVWKEAFNKVQVGYKLPDEEDSTTYIGIMFETQAEESRMIQGAKIINWAKYTLYDHDGQLIEDESYAVACIITVGDIEATEVKNYENVINIESMDDAELEDHERTEGSIWEIAGDNEYYMASNEGVMYEGLIRQPCLVI